MREAGERFLRFFSHRTSYPVTEALFLRLLGLVYLTAFAALWPQITGLIGSHGIVPAATALLAMRTELGAAHGFLIAPSLFWLGISDPLLLWCCALGCGSAVVMIVSRKWVRAAAIVCWVLYLSLVSVGSPFLTFQWDALLLEAGVLAFLAGAPWLVWAYRFLLFRLMFMSGAIKFLSGDSNWESLHALRFHFVTQPLPNPLAYYAYRLPAQALDGLTALTLGIEFVAPFLLFGPRRVREVGVGLLVMLQIGILLTGNYAFFNLLALGLCVWGLDDGILTSLSRFATPAMTSGAGDRQTRAVGRAASNLIIAFYIALSGAQVVLLFHGNPGRALHSALEVAAPFQVANSYGLFAVMTTTRPELILQGSNDQDQWLDYSFKYKPGELHRGLPLIAPYQPRLDWQMWFAALGTYTENPWVGNLMYRVLVGDPLILNLMDRPPFSRPPRYLRAMIFDYNFTTPQERSKTGAVWKRTLQGVWFGPVSLTGR